MNLEPRPGVPDVSYRFALRLLIGLALGVALINYANLAVLRPLSTRQWDFSVLYTGGYVLRHGQSLYDLQAMQAAGQIVIQPPLEQLHGTVLDSFDNPPLVGVLFAPLTLLPFHSARQLYLALCQVLYFGAVGLLVLRFLGRKPALPVLAAAGFIALMLEPVYQSFALGQTDVPLLFLIAFTLWAEDRDRSVAAGIALGLAAAIKISPGVLILYFLLRRRWSLVIAAALTALAATTLALSVAGTGQMVYWLTHILPELLRGSPYYQNQSIAGVLYRLVMPMSGDFTDGVNPPPDLAWLRLLIAALNLGIFAVGARLLQPLLRLARYTANDLGPGLAVMVMLLGSSLTWEHYLVWTLVPLFALLGGRWIEEGRHAFSERVLIITLAAYLLIIIPLSFFLPEADFLWGRLGLNVKFYGLLALLAAIAYPILQGTKRSLPDASPLAVVSPSALGSRQSVNPP